MLRFNQTAPAVYSLTCWVYDCGNVGRDGVEWLVQRDTRSGVSKQKDAYRQDMLYHSVIWLSLLGPLSYKCRPHSYFSKR